jgi:hypothetical protein
MTLRAKVVEMNPATTATTNMSATLAKILNFKEGSPFALHAPQMQAQINMRLLKEKYNGKP